MAPKTVSFNEKFMKLVEEDKRTSMRSSATVIERWARIGRLCEQEGDEHFERILDMFADQLETEKLADKQTENVVES